MSERALKTAPQHEQVSHPEDVLPESPGTRLLDALRAGDDTAVLAAVSQSTTVTAENMPWACRGPDEVATMLREARERFPGLTFESSARHVGFGIVIEEARVRDLAAETAAPTPPEALSQAVPEAVSDPATGPAPSESGIASHPMFDSPTAPTHRAVTVWRDLADQGAPPAPLDMPMRLTVKHDDLQVHEVTLSFPAALLKRALGMRVDPLEVSLSEVQSAFIAPVGGAGLITHRLARPELAMTPPPAVDAPETAAPADQEAPRRRRRVLVPVLVMMLAASAGAGWWVMRGSNASDVATPPVTSTTPHVTPTPTPTPTSSPTPSGGLTPSVEPSTPVRSRKPNVTLKSDLAFGFDSALLSGAAKQAIAQVAHQVRHAHLVGTIYVDGYTDSLGSAAYGKVLSQSRADAVATYLRSHLGNAQVTVVPVGHGEAHPIASNATPAGQKQNRRVTITLPRP